MRIQRRAAKLPGSRRGWIVTRALIHQIGTLPPDPKSSRAERTLGGGRSTATGALR